MCPASSPRRQCHSLPKLRDWLCSTATLAAALAATNCTAPLGPGYTVERQRFEVAFVSAPLPHLDVRVTWTVKNTGDRPLSAVEVKLPKPNTHGRSGLHLASRGVDVTPSDAQAADSASVAFPSPLAVKAKQEIGVSYELAGASGQTSGVVVTQRGFVFPPGDWAPALLPPKGTFARGGVPPKHWEMTVRVPAGFRVHASGRVRGEKKGTDGVVYRFEQRRGGGLPFAVGGAYQEERSNAAGAQVIFWTRQAMPAGLAQRAAEAVAQSAGFYDAEFGPRDSADRTVWIIECPSERTCWPVPGAALPGHEVDILEFWSAHLSLIDQQLAFTWLDFRVHPDWDAEPLPMSALANYAADLAAAARQGGEARRQIVRELVREFDRLRLKEAEPAVLLIRRSDPEPARRFAAVKSELFFFALEDAAGRDNLHHALLHLLAAFSGRAWLAIDLRAAVEQESGKDLAALFREWLTEPGIPGEFRSRY